MCQVCLRGWECGNSFNLCHALWVLLRGFITHCIESFALINSTSSAANIYSLLFWQTFYISLLHMIRVQLALDAFQCFQLVAYNFDVALENGKCVVIIKIPVRFRTNKWIIKFPFYSLSLSLCAGLSAELYYVRDGLINEYALHFTVPVPANLHDITFTWQSLAGRPVNICHLLLNLRYSCFMCALKFPHMCIGVVHSLWLALYNSKIDIIIEAMKWPFNSTSPKAIENAHKYGIFLGNEAMTRGKNFHPQRSSRTSTDQ